VDDIYDLDKTQALHYSGGYTICQGIDHGQRGAPEASKS